MSITVNSTMVAEVRIQGLTVRPVVGAYELVFGLDVTINPQTDFSRHVSVVGARVDLRTDRNPVQAIGFARPESSFEMKQWSNPGRMTPALVLPLQPGQLATIERLRDGGDLGFELLASAVGTDRNGDQLVQDQWRVDVPRSDWIKKLAEARARDILLIEVPLPVVDSPKEWAEITNHLRRAEAYLRNGDHRACVASCRTVLEELGHRKFGKKGWSGALLERLAKDRDTMTTHEREAALWPAVMHYTHPAHHASSVGGSDHYSRGESQLLLAAVAALVGYAQNV